jgi:hypothetical protein
MQVLRFPITIITFIMTLLFLLGSMMLLLCILHHGMHDRLVYAFFVGSTCQLL